MWDFIIPLLDTYGGSQDCLAVTPTGAKAHIFWCDQQEHWDKQEDERSTNDILAANKKADAYISKILAGNHSDDGANLPPSRANTFAIIFKPTK